MRSLRYPAARWRGGATTYGPQPTHGNGSSALVLHTTETVGMPGFSNGDTAPHLVYDPRDRTWTQLADLNRYVGTMKGHSSGHWNCKAIQVEILAYSDRAAAGSKGIWVGDFTSDHYQDLAGLYAWLIAQEWVGLDLTPTPAGGWKYGTGSPYRLTPAAYAALSGLTCHGAVPGNTHWDTGVLELQLIWGIAVDGDAPPPTNPPGMERTAMWPMYETDGYTTPSGSGRTTWRDNVKVLQGMVRDAGGQADTDGKLGPGTIAEVARVTGIPVKNGTVTGDHGAKLNAMAAGSGGGGLVPHTHTTPAGVTGPAK